MHETRRTQHVVWMALGLGLLFTVTYNLLVKGHDRLRAVVVQAGSKISFVAPTASEAVCCAPCTRV